MKVKVLATQSCLPLCDPMDCSLPDPLSMEFSKQEYWSGLPLTSSGNLNSMVSSHSYLILSLVLSVPSTMYIAKRDGFPFLFGLFFISFSWLIAEARTSKLC